jgi:CheY-like chemotaxis protein
VTGLRGHPPPAGEVLRVVVADESCSFRDGLGFLLQTGGVEVVSSVGELSSLLESVARHEPDVVVVDADLGATDAGSGVSAVLRLKAERPALGPAVATCSRGRSATSSTCSTPFDAWHEAGWHSRPRWWRRWWRRAVRQHPLTAWVTVTCRC